MKVIGFNFTRMSAERLKDSAENIKINTEMEFPEIKRAKSQFFKAGKEDMIEVKFEYKVNYEPGLAKIAIHGTMFLSVEEKTSEEILKQWKKKALPEDFRIFISNIVMKKATLKALNLCDELNLPIHIPMPVMRKESK